MISQKESSSANIKESNLSFQVFVLVAGFMLMGIKFSAWLITDSNAIFSDALESIVNVTMGAFALFSLKLASMPRDQSHPYGHGKIEFISSGIEGTMIALAGLSIIAKSIYSFILPQELHKLDIGILLSISTGIVNFGLGHYSIIRGKRSNSMTLVAAGKHLKSDAWSTAGLVIGLTLIFFTKVNWLDSCVAILFGLMIIYTGVGVVRHSVAGLMDETDIELLKKIIHTIEENRKEDWVDVHNMRVVKYGADLHIDCHLTLPWYMSLEEGHKRVEEIEDLVRKYFDNVELFIHEDPCIPSSCEICILKNCPERKFPFKASLNWDLELVMKNQKHNSKEKIN